MGATLSDPRLKRLDTSVLWPKFAADICRLLDLTSRHHGISGYRSVTEQNDLFAQGRTKPGNIVTKARGGESYHNFAVAIDFAFDTDTVSPGLQPGWNQADYLPLAEAAHSIPSLESGFYWKFKDPGHIQINTARLGVTEKLLKSVWDRGGMVEVFVLLDELEAAAVAREARP